MGVTHWFFVLMGVNYKRKQIIYNENGYVIIFNFIYLYHLEYTLTIIIIIIIKINIDTSKGIQQKL